MKMLRMTKLHMLCPEIVSRKLLRIQKQNCVARNVFSYQYAKQCDLISRDMVWNSCVQHIFVLINEKYIWTRPNFVYICETLRHNFWAKHMQLCHTKQFHIPLKFVKKWDTISACQRKSMLWGELSWGIG